MRRMDLDERIGELAGEAVGAEQKQVAGFGFELEDVGSDAALRAQSARDDVAQRGAQRFQPAHLAHPDLFLDQRVIESDLLQVGVGVRIAQAVAAAVAHVDHPRVALVDQKRHQRGAHAIELWAALRARENGLIGGS